MQNITSYVTMSVLVSWLVEVSLGLKTTFIFLKNTLSFFINKIHTLTSFTFMRLRPLNQLVAELMLINYKVDILYSDHDLFIS